MLWSLFPKSFKNHSSILSICDAVPHRILNCPSVNTRRKILYDYSSTNNKPKRKLVILPIEEEVSASDRYVADRLLYENRKACEYAYIRVLESDNAPPHWSSKHAYCAKFEVRNHPTNSGSFRMWILLFSSLKAPLLRPFIRSYAHCAVSMNVFVCEWSKWQSFDKDFNYILSPNGTLGWHLRDDRRAGHASILHIYSWEARRIIGWLSSDRSFSPKKTAITCDLESPSAIWLCTIRNLALSHTHTQKAHPIRDEWLTLTVQGGWQQSHRSGWHEYGEHGLHDVIVVIMTSGAWRSENAFHEARS